MAEPLERHLLYALPWLAAFVAAAAAHVSVVRELPASSPARAAPLVNVDVDLDMSLSAPLPTPKTPAPSQALALPDLSGVRMVPAIHDGEPVGVKLFGIPRDSTLALLGLRNGDLIVRVDGRPVLAGSPTVVPYRSLSSKRRVTVDIVRRGEPISLTYALEEGLRRQRRGQRARPCGCAARAAWRRRS